MLIGSEKRHLVKPMFADYLEPSAGYSGEVDWTRWTVEIRRRTVATVEQVLQKEPLMKSQANKNYSTRDILAVEEAISEGQDVQDCPQTEHVIFSNLHDEVLVVYLEGDHHFSCDRIQLAGLHEMA